MKEMSTIAKDLLPKTSDSKPVDLICALGGWRKLPATTMSSELQCPLCEGKEHYTVYANPPSDARRVWICAKGDCESNTSMKYAKTMDIPVKAKRAVLWPLFCEINGIGDVYHDVKFEDIEQEPVKVEYMKKFADSPKGIILMQGVRGKGKTFASMGICEYFTRTDPSCTFTTQKQMAGDLLDTFKEDKFSNYIQRMKNVTLLVIDDFGTAQMTPNFLSFFMDLISHRMQWLKKGTIITTNLENDDFSEYCGDSLNDRIRTGKKMIFTGDSRRKKTIL